MTKNIIIAVLAAACVWLASVAYWQRGNIAAMNAGSDYSNYVIWSRVIACLESRE